MNASAPATTMAARLRTTSLSSGAPSSPLGSPGSPSPRRGTQRPGRPAVPPASGRPEPDRSLGHRARRRHALEQRQVVALDAAQLVVVELDAGDPTVGGEHLGLRLELLGSEDAAHRTKAPIAVEPLEVPRQLLDA